LVPEPLPFRHGFIGQRACQQLRACAGHFEGAKLGKSLVSSKRFGKLRPEVASQLRACIDRKLVQVRLAA
jgi:hypothetical protein